MDVCRGKEQNVSLRSRYTMVIICTEARTSPGRGEREMGQLMLADGEYSR